MRSRRPAEVAEWYDKLSGSYEELYGDEQSNKYRRALEMIDGQSFSLVLDVACGTGMFLHKLRGRCNYAVGVDLSRRMLQIAKRRLVFEDVDLIRADCRTLPLMKGVADLLSAVSLMEANPQARMQASELARVTKPNGGLLVTVFHREGTTVSLEELGLKHLKNQAELSARESLFYVSE